MPDDRVADRVSADMERIFRRRDLPPATPVSRPARETRSRDFVLHAAPPRTMSVRLMRALTIAVPLLTIAVAAFLFLQIGSDIRPAAAVAAAPPRPATVVAPSTAAAAGTRPTPVAYLAVAPAVGEAPVAVKADVGQAPAARAIPASRPRGTAPVLAAAPPVAPDRDCLPGSEEDRCIYREVREADRRLVAAYRAAAAAGVPRREMVAVRRVWTRALAVSLDDPDGTIRTYDDLARRLHDATLDVRADRQDGDEA